jgi:hypothetical protein
MFLSGLAGAFVGTAIAGTVFDDSEPVGEVDADGEAGDTGEADVGGGDFGGGDFGGI